MVELALDGSPAPTSGDDVVVILRNSAQALIDQHALRDPDVLIGHLVAAAVTMVPAAVGGGISRTEERAVRSSHATSRLIHELDQLQDSLGEGPCIRAADDPPPTGIVLVRDLDGPDGEQWPRFAPRAVAAGFRSMLSVSLTGPQNHHQSALNLYAATPDAFDNDARTVTSLFAIHAGALLYGADQAAGLATALGSRDVIGQAKGILMERFSVNAEQAFAMLRESSMDTNIKLADVARWVVGETDERRPVVNDRSPA